MPVVPSQRTWADEDALDTTNLNGSVSGPLRHLLNPPIAELRQTAAQSLPNNTWTGVIFDLEDVDTDVDGVGGHSTVSNRHRYTARYPGWYQCSGGVGFATNTTGIRGVRWAVNGTGLSGNQATAAPTTGAVASVPARTKYIYLDEGDFVELQAFQSSGGALNTAVTADQQPSASIRWVSN